MICGPVASDFMSVSHKVVQRRRTADVSGRDQQSSSRCRELSQMASQAKAVEDARAASSSVIISFLSNQLPIWVLAIYEIRLALQHYCARPVTFSAKDPPKHSKRTHISNQETEASGPNTSHVGTVNNGDDRLCNPPDRTRRCGHATGLRP